MLISLAVVTVLAQAPASRHPVPAWLPRDVQLGFAVKESAVSPVVRVGWQVGLIEQPRNDLLAVFQLGTGLAIARPTGLNALYQHVAMAGIGYSSTRERFHWGFHVVAGVLWYRAAWAQTVGFRFESRVMGTSEGFGEIGLKVAPNLLIGLRAGLGGGWEVNSRYPATALLGGFQVALFANWR